MNLFGLNEFCVYELIHGRNVPIWFENDRVREIVVASICHFFAKGLKDLDKFLVQSMMTQRDRYAQLPSDKAASFSFKDMHYKDWALLLYRVAKDKNVEARYKLH